MIVCYDLWTGFFPPSSKSKDRKKLLELALWDRDPVIRFSSWFGVTGLDLSADMLKIAEKKSSFSQAKLIYGGNMLDLSSRDL